MPTVLPRRSLIFVASASVALLPQLVFAQAFTDAPISCGAGSHFKECTATFDGRRLSINYKHPEGKHSVVVYGKCIATDAEIQCIDGEWRSASGSGPIGSRSIGLKDGRPFKD